MMTTRIVWVLCTTTYVRENEVNAYNKADGPKGAKSWFLESVDITLFGKMVFAEWLN